MVPTAVTAAPSPVSNAYARLSEVHPGLRITQRPADEPTPAARDGSARTSWQRAARRWIPSSPGTTPRSSGTTAARPAPM